MEEIDHCGWVLLHPEGGRSTFWVYVLTAVAVFTATIAWFGRPRGTSRRDPGTSTADHTRPGQGRGTLEDLSAGPATRERSERRDRTWRKARRHTAARRFNGARRSAGVGLPGWGCVPTARRRLPPAAGLPSSARRLLPHRAMAVRVALRSHTKGCSAGRVGGMRRQLSLAHTVSRSQIPASSWDSPTPYGD
jgi:hypothetical protein